MTTHSSFKCFLCLTISFITRLYMIIVHRNGLWEKDWRKSKSTLIGRGLLWVGPASKHCSQWVLYAWWGVVPFAHDYSSLEWSLRDSNNICHVLIRQGPYLTWKWVREPDYTHRWTGNSCPHGRACQEALQSVSPLLVEDLVPFALTWL